MTRYLIMCTDGTYDGWRFTSRREALQALKESGRPMAPSGTGIMRSNRYWYVERVRVAS